MADDSFDFEGAGIEDPGDLFGSTPAEQNAVLHASLIDAYTRAGFSRAEAMQLLCARLQAPDVNVVMTTGDSQEAEDGSDS